VALFLAKALSQHAQISPFAETIRSEPWVALAVRFRLERSVQQGLTTAGLETFVPWHTVRRRRTSRVRTTQQNLFPGYVFCRSTFSDRQTVMSQPGVAAVVSFNRTPATIPDSEIEALRRAIQSGSILGPWPFLQVGQRVRIERGVLSGIEGILARNADGWNLIVSVEVLQRSIAIAVERDMIRPI
jgi:transcription antitermination factor NusG